MIAAALLGNAGENILEVLRLGAEARDVPLLIEIDLVAVFNDVLAGLLSPVAAVGPLNLDRRRITGVVYELRLVEQPIAMRAISRSDDDRRWREAGLGDLGPRFFDRDVINIRPQAADNSDLPREIEPAFRSDARAYAEEQVQVVGSRRIVQELDRRRDERERCLAIARPPVVDAALFPAVTGPCLDRTEQNQVALGEQRAKHSHSCINIRAGVHGGRGWCCRSLHLIITFRMAAPN